MGSELFFGIPGSRVLGSRFWGGGFRVRAKDERLTLNSSFHFLFHYPYIAPISLYNPNLASARAQKLSFMFLCFANSWKDHGNLVCKDQDHGHGVRVVAVQNMTSNYGRSFCSAGLGPMEYP